MSLTRYISSYFFLLNNCFNICLFKLFKFKPDFTSDFEDDARILREFIEKLHSYDLFTLQSRILNKVSIFAHGIKTNVNAPVELKFNKESGIVAESSTQDTSKPFLAVFKIRKGDKANNLIPESKFET